MPAMKTTFVLAVALALAGCTAASPRPPEVGTGVSPSAGASGAVSFDSTVAEVPKEYWKLDEQPAEERSEPSTQP